jgi:hypothetical protein
LSYQLKVGNAICRIQLLTGITTLRQLGRDVWEFLEQAWYPATNESLTIRSPNWSDAASPCTAALGWPMPWW